MRQALRLCALAALALLAVVPTATASHDPSHWFSGQWHMVFPDEPAEGPLTLRASTESAVRQEIADQGYRFTSWMTGNCGTAKVQWYVGSAERGDDKGPLVARVNTGSGLIYAVFKSIHKARRCWTSSARRSRRRGVPTPRSRRSC